MKKTFMLLIIVVVIACLAGCDNNSKKLNSEDRHDEESFIGRPVAIYPMTN